MPSRLARHALPRASWFATAAAILLLVTFIVEMRQVEFSSLGIFRSELRSYGRLPSFQLRDQNAQAFTDKFFQNRITVVNFIFTRCPTICPLMTQKMTEIQGLAKERGLDLWSTSFSVDPEYDTPERLTAFASKYRIDTSRWHLVTGDLEPLEATVVDGFRVSMGRSIVDSGNLEGSDELVNIFHGDHFVLVDSEGTIRGYYAVVGSPDSTEQLLADAELLLEKDSAISKKLERSQLKHSSRSVMRN